MGYFCLRQGKFKQSGWSRDLVFVDETAALLMKENIFWDPLFFFYLYSMLLNFSFLCRYIEVVFHLPVLLEKNKGLVLGNCKRWNKDLFEESQTRC